MVPCTYCCLVVSSSAIQAKLNMLITTEPVVILLCNTVAVGMYV